MSIGQMCTARRVTSNGAVKNRRYLTEHMQNNKKDYASLRGLTAMVTRRRKLLEFLLREDLPEFKRITSELGPSRCFGSAFPRA